MFVTVKYRRGRCLLSDRLRERGYTQTQLADRTGYDKSIISKYVKGTRGMNFDTAKTIAAAINCTIDDLYEWIEYD
ncbi:helix-turn-helix domain-containing protein [Bacillus altitudinis]|uniref:helix-turn-helix domain-containing protein n=1 Tax=Bacillus altitudinis TaxID=293387 RepID=UPI003CF11506